MVYQQRKIDIGYSIEDSTELDLNDRNDMMDYFKTTLHNAILDEKNGYLLAAYNHVIHGREKDEAILLL